MAESGCRLYVEPARLEAGPLEVRDGDYRYLFRVRRLGTGSRLILFDGQGREAEAVVGHVDKTHGLLQVAMPIQAGEPSGCRLTIIQAVIKGDRMDMCVQKLTELGVAAIWPVHTARTVVRLDAARAQRRRRRFCDIAQDAARQSRRALVPDIAPVTDFQHAVSSLPTGTGKFLLWVHEQTRSLTSLLAPPLPASICVAVGPEGGFTAAEVEYARAQGFVSAGLGPYILRSETAAISVAVLCALGLPGPTAAVE